MTNTTRSATASAVVNDVPAASATPRFWMLVMLITAVDAISKALAVEHLAPRHIPHQIIGDVVRFTLAYNPGAAFGMHLGPASRWIFAALSVVIVVVLIRATAFTVQMVVGLIWCWQFWHVTAVAG